MGVLLGGVSCVDPASILPDLMAQKSPTVNRWWGKANSFTTGPGFKPGRGHLLLTRTAAAGLSLAADHALTFSGEDPAHVVTLAKITALSSECVSPGSITDGGATYLITVADRRHLDAMVPLDKGYNIPKADGSAYMAQTLEDGVATPWTWQQIVQDIANDLSYGTLTLPFTPSGTPENLFYRGASSALWCLCDVLTRCGCDLAYDPILDEFSVVRLGSAADTYLTAVRGQRQWDGYSAEYARGYYPETLRVRFLRHPYDNTGGNSLFWLEDVTLPAIVGVQAGTFVQIDDDLTALGTSGTPTNAAALATRAADRASDWVRKRVYYDRPVLRAWRDFVPTAAGLGAYAVRKVVFDDRGGTMQTWAEQEPDGALESWRPLANLPPWYPLPQPAVPVAPIGSGSGSGAPTPPDDDGWPDTVAPPDHADVRSPEPMCILGVWYTHTWRTQIVNDGSRLRLDYYDLITRANGCCGCSGSSPASDCDCCPPGYATSVAAALFGPFGSDCADATLTGTLDYTSGAWEGTLTDGTISAGAKLYCRGGTDWRLDTVTTLADCTLLAASVPLTGSDLLAGVVGISARTGCDPPDVEAAVAAPCHQGSGSGSGGPPPVPGPPTCDCSVCPDGAVGLLAVRNFIGSLTIGGETILAPENWALQHVSGCIYQQTIFTNIGAPGPLVGWTMTLDVSAGTLIVFYEDGAHVQYTLATYSVEQYACCGGLALDPVAGDLTYAPVAPERVGLIGVGPCGPCGGVTVGCFASPVPVTLFATFTGILSGLGKLMLTYDSGDWLSSEVPYGPCLQGPTRVILRCTGTTWVLTYGTLWTPPGAAGPVDPVGLSFTAAMLSAVCPGSSTAVLSAS